MYVNVGSSVVTNILLWWGMSVINEAVDEWGWGRSRNSLTISMNLKLL